MCLGGVLFCFGFWLVKEVCLFVYLYYYGHFWLTHVSSWFQRELLLKLAWYLTGNLDWDFMVIKLIPVLVFYVAIIFLECHRAWLKNNIFEYNFSWVKAPSWLPCPWGWYCQDPGEIEGTVEMWVFSSEHKIKTNFCRGKEEGLQWAGAQECLGGGLPGLLVKNWLKGLTSVY